MSTKQLALATIKGLPEDASWQDIEAHIHLLAEVNLGHEEIKRGEGRMVTSESEFLQMAATRS